MGPYCKNDTHMLVIAHTEMKNKKKLEFRRCFFAKFVYYQYYTSIQ